MNVDKSYITGLYTDALDGQPDDFNIHSDGLMILAVATGGRTFHQTNARQILVDMVPPIAVLSLLNPRTVLHLLIQCYNSRPSYLLCTASDFSANAPYARAPDTSMSNAPTSSDASLEPSLESVLPTTPWTLPCVRVQQIL